MTIEPQQRTILIVDDQSDLVELISFVLTANNMRVLSAKNGRDGLAILEQELPSAIVLDLSMPFVDGWEMMRRMRATPRTAHLPILAVSAYAREEDAPGALQAGFDAYLMKPLPSKQLIAAIEACIQRRAETHGIPASDQPSAG
jgi:CheY-like chemotaxis protein